MTGYLLRTLSTFAIAMALPAIAVAQTLVIGSAVAQPGGTVEVPVGFIAGTTTVVGYDVRFRYPPFVEQVTTTPVNGGLCNRISGTSKVVVLRFDDNLLPLPSEESCRVRLTVSAQAPAGLHPFVVEAAALSDEMGNELPASLMIGALEVVPLQSATLSFSPPPDADGQPDNDVETALRAIDDGQAVSTIATLASGGDAATRVELACSATTGFAITAGGLQSVAAGAQPAPIELACTPGQLLRFGSLTCASQGQPGGAASTLRWDLSCPEQLLGDGFESGAKVD